jgi:hypothetical protein
MQNIHVKRYNSCQHMGQGTISPEDDSWLVAIDGDGVPHFYRRVVFETSAGKTESTYADVEVTPTESSLLGAKPELKDELDFRIVVDGHAPDFSKPQAVLPDNSPDGYVAYLNSRRVGTVGDTPHEALRGLMNYVAKMCAAGVLDHTGEHVPVTGSSPRYSKNQ